MTEERDPWDVAGERWTDVSDLVKDRYRQVVGDTGPDEDEVRAAFETIGDAARAVADSIGQAIRDPDTREQLKKMSSSVASAIGATLSQLGEEIVRPRPDDTEAVDGAAEEE